MRTAYELKKDSDFISKVQQATLTTENFGIEPTSGLFGSPEWWEQICRGKLPVYTLRGVITKRYMASMADWPEIEVQSDAGELSHWTRRCNAKEQDALYVPGQPIEIDYVMQRHRPKSFDHGAEHKQVIEIRIEPSAQMGVPGAYERLRAREIAQAILARYSVIVERALELSELGNSPHVMSAEAQRIFSNIAAEIHSPATRGDSMTTLLERWRGPVLTACKELSRTESTER
jgi:hypothetical protein